MVWEVKGHQHARDQALEYAAFKTVITIILKGRAFKTKSKATITEKNSTRKNIYIYHLKQRFACC